MVKPNCTAVLIRNMPQVLRDDLGVIAVTKSVSLRATILRACEELVKRELHKD